MKFVLIRQMYVLSGGGAENKKIAVSKTALQYPITTSNSSVRFYPTRTTNNVARISESFL